MLKTISVFIVLTLAGTMGVVLLAKKVSEPTVCALDTVMCKNGLLVGRTGPACEFVCPVSPAVAADIQAHIDEKADLITLTSPVPNEMVKSPLLIAGQARGNWFFEASFPVILTNWDGLIIAKGIATASSDWMTEEFVPFTATLEFLSPYPMGAEDFMKRGSLILQRDNPSGLPENNDALEIPVRFAE